MGALSGCVARGSGGFPIKKFEILMIWKAISTVLRWQFYAKSNKSIVIFLHVFICVSSMLVKYTLLDVLELHEYLEKIWNIRTDVKIGIFPIPILSWLGFRIFKQNWENPNEIGMVGQSVSMVVRWILQMNSQSCSSRNVRWHKPGLNVGYMYSWPGIFLRGEITVPCKRSERKICRNQWILANFNDQIVKFCFRQISGQNFSPSFYCSYVSENFVNKVMNQNKILRHDEFHVGCRKFRVIKTKFRFFEGKFHFGETKYCFMERKFRTRLGRELFNWAVMSCSIRVRIVYKSWSPFLVSSIKSLVQKTSSLTHRLQAPDRFCKKDENLFRFFPWQCFALAFSLKALLYLQSFRNGHPRKSNERLEPFHFNCKACNTL